ncbi:hypothetical protein I6L25_06195 [Acinetobacter nosocomialis]|uniref:hypothetical protein n=1 Tax=Acinetobacter nosocomialis TaxID=106654 RepID=UPI0002CDCE61|nr:hypothetical protein [Acinetobacter nosocomialis]EJB8487569.1 hypothetical protein [Acinetobacter baumannii]ENU47572.1 hypothetical protein F984_00988 [Acinetobacter nosocomialis NIPH 2119]MBO1279458.1 hypothetical protein [Acinetobacter nosocomialis]MCU4551613.1 hypothetical protein [Acinetobacter nosocomialis]QCA00781.1 hypothetical protein KAN01_09165 [Acinetobacter nosocomialis]
MPRYLAIADTVYKKIKNENLFTEDTIENLNCLIGLIRQAIKGTEFQLIHNYINFEECLTKPLADCTVKIDLSLMPNYKNGDEFILWLAGFIEKITTGGKPKLPPISQMIPKDYAFTKEIIPVSPTPEKEENVEMIINYFKSEDYLKKTKISS